MGFSRFTCFFLSIVPDPFAGHCTSPYSVPTLPHVSLYPEGLLLRQNGSRLTLACNILEAPPTSSSQLSTVHTFSWHINGKVVRHNISKLEIVASEETEGVYRCMVWVEHKGQNTSLATAVSNAVTLQLPSKNWAEFILFIGYAIMNIVFEVLVHTRWIFFFKPKAKTVYCWRNLTSFCVPSSKYSVHV